MKTFFTYLKGDRVIWMITILLGLLSLVSVYSFTSILTSQHKNVSTEDYLFKHVVMLVTGILLMYYAHNLKFTYYSKLSKLAIWLAAILLLLTMFIGVSINSADRWIVIPFLGINFQTSDFAKLVLIIYVARMLAINQPFIHEFKKGVLPILIPVIVICALILPGNFSTAAMLFALCFVMMFFGRVQLKHLGLIVAVAVAGFLFLVLLAKVFPDLLPRLETWINRFFNWSESNPAEAWQINNAKGAIYHGGLTGVGPGNGTLKTILPQAYADFIFASFIEEFGIIGGVILVLLYLILFYRAIRIASKSEKVFGTFMVAGLGMHLLVQAFINMMVCTGLVPVTGQNMPLLSMGGTSTWFTCLSIGIILSVSRSVTVEVGETEKVKPKTSEEKTDEKNAEGYAVA
ncbi:MAG TPA: FtsW/RodA/SpoVE family cell cycle protein [Flavobacteriales bacterium]|nr:FtsW/RodA/SpoVE family cell cycle protein [Flavobacteriales bacterium]